MATKYSQEIVAEAVTAFWQETYPQDVIAFFYQKYEWEDKWWWQEELVESEYGHNYETMTFLNDFCEGQTCVKDITIVPLREVTRYYAEQNHLIETDEP